MLGPYADITLSLEYLSEFTNVAKALIINSEARQVCTLYRLREVDNFRQESLTWGVDMQVSQIICVSLVENLKS